MPCLASHLTFHHRLFSPLHTTTSAHPPPPLHIHTSSASEPRLEFRRRPFGFPLSAPKPSTSPSTPDRPTSPCSLSSAFLGFWPPRVWKPRVAALQTLLSLLSQPPISHIPPILDSTTSDHRVRRRRRRRRRRFTSDRSESTCCFLPLSLTLLLSLIFVLGRLSHCAR